MVEDDPKMIAVGGQHGVVGGQVPFSAGPVLVEISLRPLMDILPPAVSREQIGARTRWDSGEGCHDARRDSDRLGPDPCDPHTAFRTARHEASPDPELRGNDH
ncbi:MAG TPA: hypothetical protein VIV12_10165 [Streptosporangiaceae bacterium]